MPVLALLLWWLEPRARRFNLFSFLLALLIGLNGFIVAGMHLQWETRSSLALRVELGKIQRSGRAIIVDYGWFKRSVEEKLKRNYIPFTSGSLPGPDSLKHPLPSVVEGYPNQVMYQLE